LWELVGILDFDKGTILDTTMVWNVIKDIDDKMREDESGNKFNMDFVGLLKEFHKKNLTSKGHHVL